LVVVGNGHVKLCCVSQQELTSPALFYTSFHLDLFPFDIFYRDPHHLNVTSPTMLTRLWLHQILDIQPCRPSREDLGRIASGVSPREVGRVLNRDVAAADFGSHHSERLDPANDFLRRS
jgi:hypothetical protein